MTIVKENIPNKHTNKQTATLLKYIIGLILRDNFRNIFGELFLLMLLSKIKFMSQD